jgi:hypothetical protein
MLVEGWEKYPSQSFLSTSTRCQVTGNRLPYFQNSSLQYQAQYLQLSNDMVSTARDKK